jgi:hypothetical protein
LSNPNALTVTLREALSSPNLRAELTERGLERAEKFSWHATAEIVWKSLHVV